MPLEREDSRVTYKLLAFARRWSARLVNGTAHTGSIVAALKAARIYDDTAIIISGDHGENMAELGMYAEHGTADEFTCHVPMIIKFPGGLQGKRDSAFHYSFDLIPTLIELLGGKPDPLRDGNSFAATIRDGTAMARDEIIFGQCCHVCQRSVRWDKWIYIRTYHDGFHLFPQEMVFDLEADPHEEQNLAAQRPDTSVQEDYVLANSSYSSLF